MRRDACWRTLGTTFARRSIPGKNPKRQKRMDKFVIEGGTPLHGSIATNGSKNSALPALAAALLTDEEVVLDRIPQVRDIRTMERLLIDIGSGDIIFDAHPQPGLRYKKSVVF